MGCGRLMTEKDLEQLGVSSRNPSKHEVERGVERAWTKESAKQEMWRRVANDPKQPSYLRGWVKQEINRMEGIREAKRAGREYIDSSGNLYQGPGGSHSRMRTHPSFDAGHKIPGIHHPDNLRPELRSSNRSRPGIARSLGIEKYR